MPLLFSLSLAVSLKGSHLKLTPFNAILQISDVVRKWQNKLSKYFSMLSTVTEIKEVTDTGCFEHGALTVFGG
jgi:hypothetical protein